MSSIEDDKRILLVFDFDHSIIEENSDLHVRKLAPGGVLTDSITALYKNDGWTDYMAEIFKYLHSIGKTQNDILDCMDEIKLIDGMEELFAETRQNKKFDHIIISDSNSLFINHILNHYELGNLFQVFTNPAKFNSEGCLTIEKYHIQDWCTLSTINLCKGHILKEYISTKKSQGTFYSCVIYVGDGYNDLCPGLTLQKQDILMPRKGFRLEKEIKKILENSTPENELKLSSKIEYWLNGCDISKTLHQQNILH